MLPVQARRLIAVLGALTLAACSSADNTAKKIAGPTTPSTPAGPAAPVAASLTAVSPTFMMVPELGIVPQAPTVVVRDQYGAPMTNVAVAFSVTGSGAVTNSLALSDANGVATCGRWTVGTLDGKNSVIARTGALTSVQFDVYVVQPDPPGSRYDLVSRDGNPLRAGDVGWIVLSGDNTFRLTWIWGLGLSNTYIIVNRGTYSNRNATFAFTSEQGEVWATGALQGTALTFTYDDSLDCGFPCTEVEVYARSLPPAAIRAGRAR